MIYFNIFFMIFIKGGKDYDVFKKNYLYLIFMFFFGKYQLYIVVSLFYVILLDNVRKILEQVLLES